ncbi:MAG TPA: YicC/YloC family endoribonuclease [Gemmatimonadales bacterium]|nr:YicC/YloC family endoribonuclease [Gemmatimonadales bacterium]
MPNSMTGFGVADGPAGGGRLQIEIRTVNHRHFNVQLRLPGTLQPREEPLRQRLRTRIERGHVSVAGRWLQEPTREAGLTVDLERARAVVAALQRLQAELRLPGAIDLGFVARQPEVVRLDAGGAEPAVDPMDVLAIADRALEDVVGSRAGEGLALAQELRHRLDLLEARLAEVRQRAPERVVGERDRLRAAVAQLLDGAEADPQRVAQEIAFLAERLDITEEMVRLVAHLKAARATLDGSAPAGRRLGFLAQEMLREINTIGSKANDAVIAQAVIAMKEELERFREQLENLE